MKLNEIRPAKGAVRERRRVGRGTGSGLAGTAGKGHKGEQARAGASKRKSFEGGQMKLTRRIPKFGFTNPFRVEYQVVNVRRLEERFRDGDTVDATALLSHGLLQKKSMPIKVLGAGELTKKLAVRVDAMSASARRKIEAAGGSVETKPPAAAAAAGKGSGGVGPGAEATD
jgi:large subunit ribosomal protein L15